MNEQPDIAGGPFTSFPGSACHNGFQRHNKPTFVVVYHLGAHVVTGSVYFRKTTQRNNLSLRPSSGGLTIFQVNQH